MNTFRSVHLPVAPSLILLNTLITSKCHIPRLFGFKLSQTALFVQTAFYFLWFYVVILKILAHKREDKLKLGQNSYFVSFGGSQSVLKIPVSEFVHFQVFSPSLADGEEEPLVRVPALLVPGLDLLVDVLALLLTQGPGQAPGRNSGQ